MGGNGCKIIFGKKMGKTSTPCKYYRQPHPPVPTPAVPVKSDKPSIIIIIITPSCPYPSCMAHMLAASSSSLSPSCPPARRWAASLRAGVGMRSSKPSSASMSMAVGPAVALPTKHAAATVWVELALGGRLPSRCDPGLKGENLPCFCRLLMPPAVPASM